MNLRRIRFRVRRSLAERGFADTIRLAFRKGLQPKRHPFDEPKRYADVHPFDQQFDVETSGLLHAEDLSAGESTAGMYNAGYFGVAPSAFRQMVQRLQLAFTEYTFVDLGSGKGRGLLLASEFPFRAIRGVEISSHLHAIAVNNIARYKNPGQQCHDVVSMQGDATDYVFPSGKLLVYMWNPFEGPVFTSMLTNLESSLAREPRDICVLYVQPNHQGLFGASKHWRELWRQDFEMSDEDYAACAFPNRAEPCTAFRSVVPA